MTSRIAYLEAVVGTDITSFRRGMTEARGMLLSFGSDISERMRVVGRNLTLGITVPTIAIGSAMLNTAVDFDAAMRNVASISEVVARDFARSSATVLEWGSSIRAGPIEAANALNTVMQAGFGINNFDEALRVAQIAAITAEAGMADLTTTTEALIAVLLSYQGTADDAAYYSDVLTRMVQVGVGTMGEFGNAIAQVLPSAVTLGVEFSEIGGMMAYLTQRGFVVSRAATSLANAFNKMISPSEEMSRIWTELGVSSGRELIQTFGGVRGALNAIFELARTSPDAARLINQIYPDERGRRAIQLAMADVEAYNQTISDFFADVTGSTARAHEQQMQSFAAQFDLLRSSVQRFAITIGNIILPEIMPFITQLTDSFNRLAELNPDLLRFGITLVAVAAALGPLIWLMGALLTPGGMLVTLLASLAAVAFTDFNGWGTAISNELYRVLPALKLVESAIRAFFSVLLSDDLGAGSGPVVSVINSAVSNFRDQLANMTLLASPYRQNIGRSFGQSPAIPFDSMDDFLPNDSRFNTVRRGTATLPFIERLISAIEASLPMFRNAFVQLFTQIYQWIEGTAIPALDNIGRSIIDSIIGFFTTPEASKGRTGFTDWFRNLFTGGLGDFKDNLVSVFTDLFPSASEGLVALFDRIGKWIETQAAPSLGYSLGYFSVVLGNLIAEGIRGIFGGVGKKNPIVSAFVEGLQAGIEDASTDIGLKDSINGLVSAVVGGLTLGFLALTALGGGAARLVSSISGLLIRAFQSVIGWVIGGGLLPILSGLASNVIGLLGSAFTAAPLLIASFLTSVGTFISSALSGIGVFLTSHAAFITAVQTAALAIIGPIIAALGGLLFWNALSAEQQGQLHNAVIDLISGIFRIPEDMIRGVIDDFASSLQDRLVEVLYGVFSLVGRSDLAEGVLTQHSRNRLDQVGYEIGQGMIESVGQGAQDSAAQFDGTPIVTQLMQNLNPVAQLIQNYGSNTGRKIAGAVKGVINQVNDELLFSFSAQKVALENSINAFTIPTNPFVAALNNVLNAIRPIIDRIIGAWNAMLSTVGSAVTVPAVTPGVVTSPSPTPKSGSIAVPPQATPIVKLPTTTTPATNPKAPVRTRAGGGVVHANVPYRVHKDETFIPGTNGLILNKNKSNQFDRPSMNQTNYIQIVTNDADKLIEDLRRRGIDLKKGIRS